MSFFKNLFGKKSNEKPDEENLPWIEASQNQWGVRVLDLRSITQEMLSSSPDPRMATNAVSYGSDDGTSFIGIEPADSTTIDANISIPIDQSLAPGALFLPRTMEHKWAIFFHDDTLIFIRSWLRQVIVTAKTIQTKDKLVIKSITGKFMPDETLEFSTRVLKYLLVSHAIGEIVPAPLPHDFESSPKAAALWAFSAYGNFAQFGVFEEGFDPVITSPMRSHSLLHIASAQGDINKIEEQVQKGISLNSLSADGFAPLHWSVASSEIVAMTKLLQLGADPNVQSVQGATPIMNAVQSNKIPHLNLLLEAHANVNAKDNRGFTSLHRAAHLGYTDIVKILLRHGADKNISSDGHTPLSIAEASGNQEIIKLLRD